jgi:hypothetical protein
MKPYREGIGLTPLILNLGSRWRGMLNFTPRPLCPRERILVPIELLASWAPEPVWTFWRRHKSLALVGVRITDRPTHSPVTIDRSGRAAEFIFTSLESEDVEKSGVEKVYVDVTLRTCIREASASNLCRHTSSRAGNFAWFFPVPPRLRIVPQLRHNIFFPSPSQLI